MSVTFEERRDGRTDAMLGVIAVAVIVPIEPVAGQCAAYKLALPPMSQLWQYADDVEAARASVTKRVNDWLHAAGLKP